MLFCGNKTTSLNECDTTPPPDIDTIPRTPDQANIISDVYGPSKGPSHPYNSNSFPE